MKGLSPAENHDVPDFKWFAVFDPHTKTPPLHATVIVAGGLASYNGNCWLSQTGRDTGRPISWKVKWWMPLIYDWHLGLGPAPSEDES